MSGGHWNFSRHLEETSEALERLADEHALLRRIEHELDLGHSGDSCLACARSRVLAALDSFFDHLSGEADGPAWDGILEDRSTNLCGGHAFAQRMKR